jgi:hypothetical protein
MQQLAYQLMRHLVAHPLLFFGQLAHALTRPPQGRLRVSPRHRLHQLLQILTELGVRISRREILYLFEAYSTLLRASSEAKDDLERLG